MKHLNKSALLLAVACSALLSSGCSSEVEGWQLDSIMSQCGDAGGVSEITTLFGVSASCRNGALIVPKRQGR